MVTHLNGPLGLGTGPQPLVCRIAPQVPDSNHAFFTSVRSGLSIGPSQIELSFAAHRFRSRIIADLGDFLASCSNILVGE